MQTQFLIVGQGLCGTWLSFYLQEAGASFLVIDEQQPASASKIASGIINPVTGRRIVKTWMIEELMPYAKQAYETIAITLNQKSITEISIIDFFPTAQMQLAFQERYHTVPNYLSQPEDTEKWREQFQFNFGAGIIEPCYLVHLQHILPAWRNKLTNNHQLQEEYFDLTELKVYETSIQYKDITAQTIIFCDGIQCIQNPYFKNLPFAASKGEMLLAEIPNLKPGPVYKKGITLVPWENNTWWVGSSYEWAFENQYPSAAFRNKATAILKEWLKIPFTIVEHKAALRPSTLERRPFVGRHPQYPSVAIFNGMGTKGCSLAPYFANALSNHLLFNKALIPQVDVQRFQKILSR